MHPRRYQSSLPLSVSPYAMRFDRSLPLCIVAFKSPPRLLLYLILHVYCTFRKFSVRNLLLFPFHQAIIPSSHPHAFFRFFQTLCVNLSSLHFVSSMLLPPLTCRLYRLIFSLSRPLHTLQECLKGVICRLTHSSTLQSRLSFVNHNIRLLMEAQNPSASPIL